MLRITSNDTFVGPHQNEAVLQAGTKLGEAKYAMIMVHGRGATAESILQLSNELKTKKKTVFLAVQADGHTWYPYSFLAPTHYNQPGLNSGLQAVYNAIELAQNNGIDKANIYILGFSQGACLATEFVARHPDKYAGLFILSGGLIGETVDKKAYSGNLQNTPVFIAGSDVDPHIPLERIKQTTEVLKNLNANVKEKVYPGMPHTINLDQVENINLILEDS